MPDKKAISQKTSSRAHAAAPEDAAPAVPVDPQDPSVAVPAGGDLDRVFLPWKQTAPLAARMRPCTLSEYVGQEHILGPGKLLRRAIEADRIGSILLWGPPGSGKTTLARVIAGVTRSHFATLNAVLAGVKDIREVVEEARVRLKTPPDLLEGPRRTTLFVDEVHRFNKSQQDALLPHVENGTVTFIGATTENPYFEVIKPLVSRSRIFQLRNLSREDLREIARRALRDPDRGYGGRAVHLEPEALEHLADMAQGDARNLLNALELAVETTPAGPDGGFRISREVAEESIQRRALLYDKDGDVHYDTISAFIKSLRGSDPDAALYWLARMVRAGEDPRFIARRLVIFASEDVGMADPQALVVATAAANAVEFVGLPECQWNLSQAVIYLSTAPKSNSAMGYFEALKRLEETGDDEVPDPLKDANRDREGLGHGKGYKYPHAFRDHWVAQQYLPGGLQGSRFYQPGELGFEAAVRERLESLRSRQAEGLSLEKRLEGLATGKARRLKAQIEEHGEARIRLRERILDAAGLAPDHQAIDLSERPGFLAWGALERAPLGKITVLAPHAAAADQVRQSAANESVDKLLVAEAGDAFSLPCADAAFDRILGAAALYARADRPAVLSEAFRAAKPGGRLILFEPLYSEGRRLSEELDLRILGAELAEKIRAAEEGIYRDPDDPRVTLSAPLLASLAEEAGWTVLQAEKSIEPLKQKVTLEQLARWFSGERGAAAGSYEEKLLRSLNRDEAAAYRRQFEEQLLGRVLVRPMVSVLLAAQKG